MKEIHFYANLNNVEQTNLLLKLTDGLQVQRHAISPAMFTRT